MGKWKLYTAMALAAVIVAGTAVPVRAASSKNYITQINGKKCMVWIVSNCTQKPGSGQPEDPVIPEIPVAPEQPDEPEIPVVPEQPNEPEAPVVPEFPDVSDTPEADASYAAQVVRLVNEERAKEGLPALTVDTGLTAAGNVRAKEIVASFSHTRPDGTSFATAIKEQGVSYRNAGENIAWGQKTPEDVVNAWMNSPGHRANILNGNFTRIGVGHYQNGSGTNYWVQLFAD